MFGALRRRLLYYAVFSVVFGMLYSGLVIWWGTVPAAVVWGALGIAVGKDLVDEMRILRGTGPIGFLALEHTPSNVVLAAFLATGVITLTGTVTVPGQSTSVAHSTVAIAVAVLDAVWDISQDLREA